MQFPSGPVRMLRHSAMNKHCLLPAFVLAWCSAAVAVDFRSQVQPVFQQYCYRCHSEVKKSEKGKLVLDNLARFATKIGPSAIIKPGDPEGSSFFTSLTLPKGDDDRMPPAKEPQPTPAHIALIKAWIAEGAALDGSRRTAAAATPAAAPTGAPAAGAALQNWTSVDGKSIQASFLRLEGENVVIQRADGICFSVPLSRLAPESQALARNGGK